MLTKYCFTLGLAQDSTALSNFHRPHLWRMSPSESCTVQSTGTPVSCTRVSPVPCRCQPFSIRRPADFRACERSTYARLQQNTEASSSMANWRLLQDTTANNEEV